MKAASAASREREFLHRDFSIFGVQRLSTVVTAVDSAPPVDGYKSSAGFVDVTIVTSETRHLERRRRRKRASDDQNVKGPHGAPFPTASSVHAWLPLLIWPAAAHTSCHNVAAAADRRSEAASGIESLDAASSLWWLAACHLAVGGIAARSKVVAKAVYSHGGRGGARP